MIEQIGKACILLGALILSVCIVLFVMLFCMMVLLDSPLIVEWAKSHGSLPFLIPYLGTSLIIMGLFIVGLYRNRP